MAHIRISSGLLVTKNSPESALRQIRSAFSLRTAKTSAESSAESSSTAQPPAERSAHGLRGSRARSRVDGASKRAQTRGIGRAVGDRGPSVVEAPGGGVSRCVLRFERSQVGANHTQRGVLERRAIVRRRRGMCVPLLSPTQPHPRDKCRTRATPRGARRVPASRAARAEAGPRHREDIFSLFPTLRFSKMDAPRFLDAPVSAQR